ncbi:MAG: LUD domain-containing protein [Myxococcales bacterium]|nr:LUD domain-containing protein [Myxococcales bacterium]
MSARTRILAAVRAGALRERAHPGRFRPGPGDASWDALAAAVAGSGAEARGPFERREGSAEAHELGSEVAFLVTRWGGGRSVAAPDAARLLGPGPWETVSVDADPASLADVAIGIVSGAVAVAENGAVGIPAAFAPQRALLFLCERLILLVDAGNIASQMHIATEAVGDSLAADAHFSWIAGPSKTADIPGTVVVGAHGPREVAVVGFR